MTGSCSFPADCILVQIHPLWIQDYRTSVELLLYPPKPPSSSSHQSLRINSQTSYNPFKTPCTNQRWNTTRLTPSVSGGNVLVYRSVSLVLVLDHLELVDERWDHRDGR